MKDFKKFVKKFFKQGIALLLAIVIVVAFVLYRSSDRRLQAGNFPEETDTGFENTLPGEGATQAAPQELLLDDLLQEEEEQDGEADAGEEDEQAGFEEDDESAEEEDWPAEETPDQEEDSAQAPEDEGGYAEDDYDYEDAAQEEETGASYEEEKEEDRGREGEEEEYAGRDGGEDGSSHTEQSHAGEEDWQSGGGQQTQADAGEYGEEGESGYARNDGQPFAQTDSDDGSDGQPFAQTDSDDGSGRQPFAQTDDEDEADRKPFAQTDSDDGSGGQPHAQTGSDDVSGERQTVFFMNEEEESENTQTDAAGAAEGEPAEGGEAGTGADPADGTGADAAEGATDQAADAAEGATDQTADAAEGAAGQTEDAAEGATDQAAEASADQAAAAADSTAAAAAATDSTAAEAAAAAAATDSTAAEAAAAAATKPVADTIVFQGPDYKVTATYGEEAGIPAGAKLVVSEIPEDSDVFRAYRAQVETTVSEDLEGGGRSADSSRASGKKDAADSSSAGEETTAGSADGDETSSENDSADRSSGAADRDEVPAENRSADHDSDTADRGSGSEESDTAESSPADRDSDVSESEPGEESPAEPVAAGGNSGVPASVPGSDQEPASGSGGSSVPSSTGPARSTAGDSTAETSMALSWIRLFDISIEVDGQPIEPKGPVAVQITYVEAIEQDKSAEVGTVHFEGTEETPKVLEIQKEGTDTSTEQVTFETEGFSVFAIYAVTIEKVVLASDGHNYRVRVTYGPDAGIPRGAALEAAEILPQDEEYEAHFARTAEAVGTGTGDILQLRLFDLRIVDAGGRHVEPKGPVEVQVTLDDPVETSQAQALQVVHFGAAGTEILNADVTGRHEGTADQFVFTTDSFSVYSIVSYGETADLDGKSFALVSPLDGRTPWAGLLAESHPTQSGRLKATACYEYDRPYTYLSAADDLTVWTFAQAGRGRYTIQADNGKYLNISANAITVSNTPQALTVETDASHAGRVHITDGNRHSMNLYNWKVTDGFGQWYDNGQNEWFRLYDLDAIDLTKKETAQKISVQDMQDAQEVLLYRRVWNETSQEFDNYGIDGNGNLIYMFNNGELLNYRSETSMLWKVIMHRDPATFELNGYYDFYNVETGKYLAPVSDGILSDSPLGVTLNGRRLGDYDSTIEGWDTGAFAWYGYRVEDGLLTTATGSGGAETFCFAVPSTIDPGTLETVRTIDSTQAGIQIRMFNFASRPQMSNLIGNDSYTNGNTNSVVKNLLGANGYPVSSKNGKDLYDLFEPNYVGTANHLFLKSVYDETGYYEYSCFNNFAVYDQESGNFTLYKDLGTPSNDNKFYYQRGNFFPYNTLDTTRAASNHNDYYGDGSMASEVDPSQGRDLYLFREKVDYYFGMTLDATFLQAKDGMDEKGEPISYTFNGDDDLWVFIDDVLILDIGGIHDAIPGSINFATGDIFVNGKKVSTIRDQFVKAGKSVDDFSGNTFADYSSHSMKMFYMERGAGASNLEIHFNLPVIEQGTFAVEKQLTGTNQQAYTNVQFAFQAFLIDPDYPDDRTKDIPLRGSGATSAGTNGSSASGTNGSGSSASGTNGSGNGSGGAANGTGSAGSANGSVGANGNAGSGTGSAGTNGGGSSGAGNASGSSSADPGSASPPRQVRVLYEGTETEVPFHDGAQIGAAAYDNVFYLQPGQAAVFYDIPDDIQYYVREIDVSGDYYETVLINDAGLGEDEGLTEGSAITATSTPRTILQRQRVLFENQCSSKNVRPLRITKHVENPNPDGDPTFEFRVTLEGPDGSMVPYIMGEYYLLDPDGNYCHYVHGQLTAVGSGEENKVVCSVSGNNGSIAGIPDGYTIVIEGLLAGTDFHVEEIRIPDGFAMTGKTVEDCDPPTTASGTGSGTNIGSGTNPGSGTENGDTADEDTTIENGTVLLSDSVTGGETGRNTDETGDGSTSGSSGAVDGSIALGKDAQVTITNRHYSYLKVNKEWKNGTCPVDKHGDIYVALYRLPTGTQAASVGMASDPASDASAESGAEGGLYPLNDEAGTASYVQGSLRTIAWPSTSVFWSLDLADGDSLANYVIREVVLQDGVAPDGGTVRQEDLLPITRPGTAFAVTQERMQGSSVADTEHTYIFTEYILGEERLEASGEGLNVRAREDTIVNRLPRLMVTKEDQDGRALEGAVFRLLRPVTEAETGDGTGTGTGSEQTGDGTGTGTGGGQTGDETGTGTGGGQTDQGTDSGGNDPALPAGLEPVPGYDSFTSDEAGRLLTNVYLPNGTYYLQETAAPEGCRLLTDLIRIDVGANGNVVYRAYLDPAAGAASGTGSDGSQYYRDRTREDSLTYTFTVVNNAAGYELPSTGGPGRGSFTLAGLLLLAFALLLYAAEREL